MTLYADDNFGVWEDMDDEDMRDFYDYCQEHSVEKTCAGCGRTVRIMPQYDVCDSCATKREQGWDF